MAGRRKNNRELTALARSVLQDEAKAIEGVASRLDDAFPKAARTIARLSGRLVVSGMGKAGFIAQKLSATFASTGTPSLFVHPADALHGDLGRLTSEDVLLVLSHSGETEEVLRLVKAARPMDIKVIAITASAASSLGGLAKLSLEMGRWEEAGNGLAPTTSTTVMLALGDALSMAVLELRGFSDEQFSRFHPAGALGRKLMRVSQLMRTGRFLPKVQQSASIKKAIAVMTQTPGRPGAALVVDRHGKLVGIFTDGDLRRLTEQGALDLAASLSSVMSKNPKTMSPGQHVMQAAQILRSHHVDQVPVVDEDERLVGLLDIQDLLDHRILPG